VQRCECVSRQRQSTTIQTPALLLLLPCRCMTPCSFNSATLSHSKIRCPRTEDDLSNVTDYEAEAYAMSLVVYYPEEVESVVIVGS